MKKLFFFIPVFLFAFMDFSVCYKKYSFIKNLIPVSETKSVTFTKTKKYIFYDPFTGLYVISSKNRNVIKFFSHPHLGWWMGGIKQNSAFIGSYAAKGNFLNFSKLSVSVPENSIISDIFCRAYGIGNGGFLDKKKLMHFVNYGYWGDIGIGVNEKMKVLYSDPFYSKIKPDEKVLSVNGKKATPEIFTDLVLLGTIGKKIKITTNKGAYFLKIRKLKYNFTPLLHYGIKIDKNLTAYLPFNLQNRYFLKSGKIIKVNNKKVTSFNELLYLLSFNKNVTITLQKDGIRIRINLKDKNGKIYKKQCNKG